MTRGGFAFRFVLSGSSVVVGVGGVVVAFLVKRTH